MGIGYRNKSKVTVEDKVSFTRKGLDVIGKVIDIRENTVMVEILDDNIRKELELANHMTVVNHKNYVLME